MLRANSTTLVNCQLHSRMHLFQNPFLKLATFLTTFARSHIIASPHGKQKGRIRILSCQFNNVNMFTCVTRMCF